MTMKITLTPEEFSLATAVASRHMEEWIAGEEWSIVLQMCEMDRGNNPWTGAIEAVAAGMALAKATDHYWDPSEWTAGPLIASSGSPRITCGRMSPWREALLPTPWRFCARAPCSKHRLTYEEGRGCQD